MRFEILCKLDNKEVSVDYNRKILHCIKTVLQKYNDGIYKEYYESGAREKDYSFSVYLPIEKIENEVIYLNNNILKITISFLNMLEAVHFYNAFIKGKGKKISFGEENNLKIISINKVQEKEIQSETVIFKTMSPVLIREKLDGNKSWYYLLTEKKGMEVLKTNLKHTLSGKFLEEDIENLEIVPIQIKKTIVSFYDIKFQSSKGTFFIRGNKKILEYFYKAGFGSKKSAGFGLLDILK